jgi:SulP family sulfate permease
MIHDWASSWKTIARSPAPLPDLLAGFTVAAVAIPLNIALAVVCGLPPLTGLIAGAIGGLLAGVFGGAVFQVTGPAAALNVMVLALTVKFGPIGVAAACILIGLTQWALMSMSAGKLVKFVPESVLAGFTTGVGIKILDNQIPEFLGFNYRFFEIAAMLHRPDWLHEVSWFAAVCGLFVAFCVTAFKDFKRFPSALVAIIIITAISVKLGWQLERVGEIPSSLPPIELPALEASTWFAIFIACTPLAVLAAIESLLSAQALDRMINTTRPHNSNLELFGQGCANIASGFFGGMPVSGVIVRSSVNIQSGSKSRMSAIIHAVILLVSVLYLSHLMELIPLSALAGLLCMVGWRLIEIKTLADLAKINKLDALAFLLAAAGTVSGHLFMGLISGGIISYIAHKKFSASANSIIQNSQPAADASTENAVWHTPTGSFIDGNVSIDPSALIAENTFFKAAENCSIILGPNCDIHSGTSIRAQSAQTVMSLGPEAKIIIESYVTISRNADIRGFGKIGSHSFIGKSSVIENAFIGAHCYVGIGALVSGVTIPNGRIVAHGLHVTSDLQAQSLPIISESMDLNSGEFIRIVET